MKNMIIIALSLVLIGFMSANLQIQTNVENAVQTIKKIFITNDGLTNNSTNTLVTINADGSGTVYIKNKLATSGTVIFSGLPNDTGNYIITIGANNNLYKTDPSAFGNGGGTNQRDEDGNTLFTYKNVGIGYIPEEIEFWVKWNTILNSGSESIYLFPNTQFASGIWGITSNKGNLRINTKTWWNLYFNYDVNADSVIKGSVAINTETGATAPTSAIDVYSPNGYDQLRLREQYAPLSWGDSNGNTGDISRWYGWWKYYIYIKTNDWRKRAALETF
jgi:hypothetical protein